MMEQHYYLEAIGCFTRAVEMMPNCGAAAFELGNFYSTGIQVDQDMGKALRYYQIAGEQNIVEAQERMVIMYTQGLGTEVDLSRARAWKVRASAQRHSVPLFSSLAQSFRKRHENLHS